MIKYLASEVSDNNNDPRTRVRIRSIGVTQGAWPVTIQGWCAAHDNIREEEAEENAEEPAEQMENETAEERTNENA